MYVKRNDRIILRKCGEFTFLIDPFLSYNSDDEDIIQLDEIGEVVWNGISDKTDFEDLLNNLFKVIEEFDEELKHTISEDIKAFLTELACLGYVFFTQE